MITSHPACANYGYSTILGIDPAPNAFGVNLADDSDPRGSSDEWYARSESKRLGFSGGQATAKEDSLSILQFQSKQGFASRFS
jgi:hypothetical protein